MSTIGAQATAVITGSFLSGAMMSLSVMAVPVLLDTTIQPHQLFYQWVRMYHYGHQVLPTMAVGTFLLYSYISAKKRTARKLWGIFALAGLTTLSMLPFTAFGYGDCGGEGVTGEMELVAFYEVDIAAGGGSYGDARDI
ncbi:hypothetical protein V491_00705 [Pseudogymnoascus sp. VKM F-3775]|nr:hypothetical protein V491_00705 [Pseudogymnoascus sp. VKM F-3775]